MVPSVCLGQGELPSLTHTPPNLPAGWFWRFGTFGASKCQTFKKCESLCFASFVSRGALFKHEFPILQRFVAVARPSWANPREEGKQMQEVSDGEPNRLGFYFESAPNMVND